MAVTFSLPALLPFAYLAACFLVAPAAYYAMVGERMLLTHAVRQMMVVNKHGTAFHNREVGMKKANGDFNDSHDHNGNQFKENEYNGNGALEKSNYCFWNPTRSSGCLASGSRSSRGPATCRSRARSHSRCRWSSCRWSCCW